jgi:hypothetical protein
MAFTCPSQYGPWLHFLLQQSFQQMPPFFDNPVVPLAEPALPAPSGNHVFVGRFFLIVVLFLQVCPYPTICGLRFEVADAVRRVMVESRCAHACV